MAFELKNTVPWGRTLEEYQSLFNLTATDLKKKIISFGDSPASFNAEMTAHGNTVTSIDPIYQFSKDAIENHIQETKDVVMQQIRANQDNFVWSSIASPDELEKIRMGAMADFVEDFETGKSQNRYIHHELPNPLDFKDQSFDLGLSSHFLLLYSQLGLEFHIQSISEMLRLCKEVRLFPLLNLDAETSEVLEGITQHFQSEYHIQIINVEYEFQKGGNQMMVIRKK
ncbi:hypothetical protein [Flammeovirga sp. SJP92]|uniref:hypothetical protein n=1 Tax=Flammeovirga sp. SJP92 TaxID=1775430 RepID=UPI00078860E4|nr:hypothetical protein [Flammeovirga sp. SJP92]KXX66829.1 SAM-dependent methyltransferase [Flammeovirga sp. SJP92]